MPDSFSKRERERAKARKAGARNERRLARKQRGEEGALESPHPEAPSDADSATGDPGQVTPAEGDPGTSGSSRED